MTRREYKKRARIFKALAHPVRLQILARLSQGSICVCDLISHLDQRQAYISQQLSILRKARLVRAERFGKRIRYELDENVLETVLQNTMEEFVGEAENSSFKQSELERNLC